ncbi:MAG: 30S ribosomal protein S3 [Candidatus Micrarchaeota archaeon]
MSIAKKVIKAAINELEIKTFLNSQLEKAGVSKTSIQKTPIATRISITVRKPGMVVGRKGANIRDLCRILETEYHIENPQIEVLEVMEPALDAKLMAEKIGKKIEARPNVKPILRRALEEIMNADPLGAEIRVAGKIVGKGGKAKTITVRAGYLKKSGEDLKKVCRGTYTASLKAGTIGITVKILRRDAGISDLPIQKEVEVKEEVIQETIEEPVKEEVEEKKEKTEEKKEETKKPVKTRKKKKE